MAGLLFTSVPLSVETTFPASKVQGLAPPSSLATFAPVFVHLPVLPSTRVRWQECWAPRFRVWKEQLPASARRQGERSQPTCGLRTWISFFSVRWATAGWKSSSSMASLCSGAIDTTMVSPVRGDKRSSHGPSQETEGAHLSRVGPTTQSRPRQLLAGLAAAKARSEPEVMRKSTMLCWLWQWSTLMACTAARAFFFVPAGLQVLFRS